MAQPLPGIYVRARIKAPKKDSAPAEHEKYEATYKAIGERLHSWVESKLQRPTKNQPGPPKITLKQAEGVARELLAAVQRAMNSGPIAADVWQTYVDLYLALQPLRSALEAASALPVQYQYLQNELAELAQCVDSLAPPLEPSADDQAILCTARARFSFQKRQRGRLKVVRAEIVRQVIAVWQHRFNVPPPATPNGVFDEVLRTACEYHGMDETSWPGVATIRNELMLMRKRDQRQSAAQDIWCFYPGKVEE